MKSRCPEFRSTVCLLFLLMSAVAHGSEPVKVFILAGQSNMEGKAKVELLKRQATKPSHSCRVFPRISGRTGEGLGTRPQSSFCPAPAS